MARAWDGVSGFVMTFLFFFFLEEMIELGFLLLIF